MRRNSPSTMKNTPKKDLSDPDARAELIDMIMKDPLKRATVLQLINSQKDAIVEYKKRERMKELQSPAEKLKRKQVFESPTSLMRRKALMELESASSSSSTSGTTIKTTPSRAVPIKSVSSPNMPFNKILQKVVAFVEVMSYGEDRSEGVKALLTSMGARVVEQLTREVTHVIFKDGSYLTYQKAKLMKIHLVSILWLDTCRTIRCKVPERDYPALGSSNCDDDVNTICNKLQNEYTKIVQDEMNESILNNDSLSQESSQNKMALLSQLGEINNITSPSSQDVIPDSQENKASEESDLDSNCSVVNRFANFDKMNTEKFAIEGVNKCNSSDDIVFSSNDELLYAKTKQLNVGVSQDIIVSSNENRDVSPKKKRRTLFSSADEGHNVNNKELNNSRRKTMNTNLNKKSTPRSKTIAGNSKQAFSKNLNDNDESALLTPNKKKRRTLYKNPDDGEAVLDSQAKAIVNSVRKSMHFIAPPEIKAPEQKSETNIEKKATNDSISSDGSKKRESIESVDFAKFVTKRKPRATGKSEVDKQGFKVPDKSNHSTVSPPIETGSIVNDSTEKTNTTSVSSTGCDMSPLQLSITSSKKSSSETTIITPLCVKESEASPDSFSPIDKLVNTSAISNIIKTLNASDSSATEKIIDASLQDNANKSEVVENIKNSESEVISSKNSPRNNKTLSDKKTLAHNKNIANISLEIDVRKSSGVKRSVGNVSFGGEIKARGRGKENLAVRRRSMRIITKQNESILTSEESSFSLGVIEDSLITSDESLNSENNRHKKQNDDPIANESTAIENSEINEKQNANESTAIENPEINKKPIEVVNDKVEKTTPSENGVQRGRGRRKTVMITKELTQVDTQQKTGPGRGRRKTIFSCITDDSPLTESNNSSGDKFVDDNDANESTAIKNPEINKKPIEVINDKVEKTTPSDNGVQRGRGRRKTVMITKELTQVDTQQKTGPGRGRRKTIFSCITDDSPLTESNNSSGDKFVDDKPVVTRRSSRRKTMATTVATALTKPKSTELKNISSSDGSKTSFYSVEDNSNDDINNINSTTAKTNEETEEGDIIETTAISNHSQKEVNSDQSHKTESSNTNVIDASSISDNFGAIVVSKKVPSENTEKSKNLQDTSQENLSNDISTNNSSDESKKPTNESNAAKNLTESKIISDKTQNITSEATKNVTKTTSESDNSSKISLSSDRLHNYTSDSNTTAKDTTSDESKLNTDNSKYSTFSEPTNKNSEVNPINNKNNPNIKQQPKNNVTTRGRKPTAKKTNEATNKNVETKNCDNENSASKKGKRRLYNPNASITYLPEIDVDKEREERVNKIVLNPSPPIMLTARTKKFIQETVIPESDIEEEEEEQSDDELINEILAVIKKTPKAKKNEKKQTEINPELDEQKDLFKEFVQKKDGKGKKAKRDDFDEELVKKRTQRESDLLLPIQRITRRSTMDFVPAQSPTPSQKRRQKAMKQPSIVCTRFHRDQVLEFRKTVKQLGKFLVQTDVTERTTHLVAAEPVRTINILRGIARGIWILKSEWLHDSVKAGYWLPEEDYELTEFSPAVQQCRMERQTFGSLHSMDIFENCGPIHVFRSTAPKHTDLEELIHLGRGRTVEISRGASIVVGKYVDYEGVVSVAYNWILDSICENVCKSFEKYLLTKP